MLNYAETARSRTIVPLPPVPPRHSQQPSTESLPVRAESQGHTDWTIDKDFGWLYQGKLGEICIPGFLCEICDAAFAQGFWRGRALMLEREDGNWYVLTDQEFTHLIAQELPTTLPAQAVASWKQGFIFGWCMTWHSQLFLDEEAEARAERQARVCLSARKRRKLVSASVPPYPNTLRACLKERGYTFREVSRETAIPESTLYYWAAGRGVIPHEFREHLAHVIGCKVEELAPKPAVVPV